MNIKDIKINVHRAGTKIALWNDQRTGKYVDSYKILLTSNDKTATFVYYDSIYNRENNTPFHKEENGKLDALRCILSNGLSYIQAVNYTENKLHSAMSEFMLEFGYIEDLTSIDLNNIHLCDLTKEEKKKINKGKKAFNGCKHSYLKLENLGMNEEILCNLLNELSDLGI